ncbi:unnamed protein product [Acanthoscelides obtectus]|uniref:Uncharacterized protein n=1 Tax=Acanthoscelides obtectus TaxID=200917 RepID=A0A9P0PKX0_ACAOB|nr:unnamed protein product [Acanthoscelides obtectus]CAK1640560.1 hypothetical protein AOBTE_LOCUS11800 [Acanthoscelides obtectus]
MVLTMLCRVLIDRSNLSTTSLNVAPSLLVNQRNARIHVSLSILWKPVSFFG